MSANRLQWNPKRGVYEVPPMPRQPLNAGTGPARAAQQQQYTNIDLGNDGVPVAGTDPQGNRRTFAPGGRTPEQAMADAAAANLAARGKSQTAGSTASSTTTPPPSGLTHDDFFNPGGALRQAAEIERNITAPAPSDATPTAARPAAAPLSATAQRYATGGDFNTAQATQDYQAGKINAAQLAEVRNAAATNLSGTQTGMTDAARAMMSAEHEPAATAAALQRGAVGVQRCLLPNPSGRGPPRATGARLAMARLARRAPHPATSPSRRRDQVPRQRPPSRATAAHLPPARRARPRAARRTSPPASSGPTAR